MFIPLGLIALSLAGTLIADDELAPKVAGRAEPVICDSTVCKGIALLSGDDQVAVKSSEGFGERLLNWPGFLAQIFTSHRLIGSDKEDLSKPHFLTSDVQIPGDMGELERRLEFLFLNQKIDGQLIAEVKNEITRYFVEQKNSVIVVQIPPQKINSGVLQVVFTATRLGELTVVGNRYTSSKLLKSYMETAPGGPIREQVLRRDLEFINRNPFRHVNAVLSPGKADNTTDITLTVDERRPLRIYAGTDNTGVKTTGRKRFFSGFNWSHSFNLLSFQYTSSYNPHKFQAYTVQYQAFMPWRHILNIYGGYSSVHPHLSYQPTTTKGKSGQGSLRYILPFTPTPAFTHDFTAGFDFKRTNNTVEFSNLFVNFAQNVNLTQLQFGYRLEQKYNLCRIDLDSEIFYSPGKWLPDQTNSDYSALRPYAKNAYAYLRASLNTLFYLPYSMFFNLLFEGQASTQNLLPSEQFGLGGYDTVRGYDERQLNTDDGALLSGEFRSPQIRVFSNKKRVRDALQFLFFVDSGWGKNYKPIPGEHTPQYLIGIGPGVRYTLDPNITARLDYGVKLHRNAEFTGGKSMIHFSVVASY